MKQFFTRYRDEIKALQKTLLWIAGNACFVLGPWFFVGILYVLGGSRRVAETAREEFLHLINDGALVFFFPALLGSIAVDVFLARKQFEHKTGKIIIFIVFSVVLEMINITVYIALLFSGTKGAGFRDLPGFQELIIGVSTFFIILAKTTLYVKEEKELKL